MAAEPEQAKTSLIRAVLRRASDVSFVCATWSIRMESRAMRVTILLAKCSVSNQLAAKVRCNLGSFMVSVMSSATAPGGTKALQASLGIKGRPVRAGTIFTICLMWRKSSGPKLQKPACKQKIPNPL